MRTDPLLGHTADGVRVAVQPDGRLPVVAVALCLRVGSVDDPPDRPGLAHVAEHLAYRHVSRALAAHTATVQAWTTRDRTGVGAVFGVLGAPDGGARVVADAVAALSALVVRPGTLVEWLAEERAVIAEERAGRSCRRGGRDDGPLFAALLPPGHPYRHSPIGDPAAESAPAAVVGRFLAEHWTPARAQLAVVGAVDPARLAVSLEPEVRPSVGLGPATPGADPDAPSGAELDAPSGAELDAPPGAELDAPPGAELDAPPGAELDAPSGTDPGAALRADPAAWAGRRAVPQIPRRGVAAPDVIAVAAPPSGADGFAAWCLAAQVLPSRPAVLGLLDHPSPVVWTVPATAAAATGPGSAPAAAVEAIVDAVDEALDPGTLADRCAAARRRQALTDAGAVLSAHDRAQRLAHHGAGSGTARSALRAPAPVPDADVRRALTELRDQLTAASP